MNRLEGILRPMVMILFAVITICVFVLGNTQSVFGQEKKEDVSGTVFQFGERGTYELSSAGKNFSTDLGIVSGGKFSITGNISSVSQRDGYPAYAVSKGNLHFSYSFATDLMNKGSIIFLVGLAMPHYRLLIPSASLDMNLRQCFRVITPTATNSGTACFLTPRRTQAS